ncbi:MAG: 1,6-anhydro-N-acetylmuramyl-L-alanine amidase AmpD [Limnobacter sp.]|nr:1,6-anhydro-N-acetylmuramyl-L-alanine amidase AmpD [Limnobacter sp.]
MGKSDWLGLPGLQVVPSPNFNERPTGLAIDSLVIHCISLPERATSAAAPLALFQNRLDYTAHPEFTQLAGLKVSSHFVIDRQGQVHQCVPCNKRAWHAGQSAAMGRSNFNDFSIGIELVGDVYTPFSCPQMAALYPLIKQLKASYPLKFAFAHSEIAPTRKTDPGPFFEWHLIRKPNTYRLL